MRSYVKDITPEMSGKEIELKGWVHETRDHGKIRFLILRDLTGTIQVTGKKGAVEDAVFDNLHQPKETVLTIKGTVKAEKQAPGGVEITPARIDVLNTVSLLLPVDPTDRLVSDLDVRLDNRHIDLRRKKVQSIFLIQSKILQTFRSRLTSMGFEEIATPCIVGTATEGGTEVFPVVYFEKEAFLVQSPQLYKQLAVIGGMEKVFMTVPIFRAEKHKTTAHLNQAYSMDGEMAFSDHNDIMKTLGELLTHILKTVKEECSPQLSSLGVDLTVPDRVPIHEYSDVVDMLNKHGHKFDWGHDFGRDEERVINELLGEEAVFVSGYPTAARAFYSMPRHDDPKTCNSYDLLYRGLEMASGSQRIHDAAMLTDAIKARGMSPESFAFYINAFKAGAPPHAGWGMGLERLTFAITRQSNIRECSLFPRDIDRIAP